MHEITFTKAKLPYGWLSSMSPHPLDYEDYPYYTAQALFQVLRFADLGIRATIRSTLSPVKAKMVARENADRMIVVPRSAADLANMRLVLTLKLSQHPELETALLETDDAVLIKDCSAYPSESGLFWGMARTPDGWRGENQLGKLWMELRATLRVEGR